MGALVQDARARTGAIDTLGCRMANLAVDEVLRADGLTFRRKAARGNHRSHVATPAQDRGLLVGVSLADGHRRLGGERGRRQHRVFDHGDIYIRDFDADYAADMDGSFDFFLIELSQDFADRAARITENGRRRELCRVQSKRDQILCHLAQALLPALARPADHDPLFIEQMAVAIGAHLLHHHRQDGGGEPDRRAQLPPQHIRHAQDMLMRDDGARPSIGDIAEALNLTTHGLFRAFRDTTGFTPYQWVLNQRIAHARRLLSSSDLSLVEIALTCGFSDQSHFTRVFGRFEGISPGRWRDRAR